MKINGYDVVLYADEFKPSMLELQKNLWGQDTELNGDYLYWKYLENPYLTTPLIYLALHRKEVIGMLGMFGAKWEIGQPPTVCVVPCVGDAVIAPEHRRRGLLKALGNFSHDDMVKRGYTYIFSLSSGPVTFHARMVGGWRTTRYLPIIRRRIKQYNIIRRVERLGNKLPFRAIAKKQSPFRVLEKNRKLWESDSKKYLALGLAPRPKEMADLVRRIGSDGRIRQIRDERYFSWRYENPLSKYCFLFWGASPLEGYLVLQTSIYSSNPTVNVVDWEGTNKEVRGLLLRAAIKWGEFDDVVIRLADPEGLEKQLIEDLGFNYSEGKGKKARDFNWPTILVRNNLPGDSSSKWMLAGRNLLDIENWDLRGSYSDAF